MTSDRGSATVIAVGILAVVIITGTAVAAVVGITSDRADARAAADLAALAGAYEVRRELAGTTADPCAVARRTAIANSATVTRCQVLGDGSVEVSVASGRAKASARAGPQEMKGPGGDSG